MAGGEGTRLRPLTSNQPKPLMPLANRPMMEHVIRLLKKHGFDDIVVTLAFLPQAIRSYFGDGAEFGVRLAYATEESPLGTAGSVNNAKAQLDDTFLVISGDVLTDIDLTALVKFHRDREAMATIALKSMENPLEFGIVITHDDGSIERFLEKPSWGQVFSDTVNTGIYVLEPQVFDYIEEEAIVDFSQDVFPRLLSDGKPLYGHVVKGYWEDVGTLEAYGRAHRDVLDQRVQVEIPGFRIAEGVWLGAGSDLDPAAIVDGPAIIGDYCKIAAGAHLGEYTVLGSNVMIGADASLDRTVVHDNGYISRGVRLRGTVVGRSSDLKPFARCEEGVVLGDDSLVGAHAVINPGVKIYPFKTVEPGAIVNSSIVWESRGSRALFGRMGITGLANVDVTPELAVQVAMAYGTTMKRGVTVTTSRDSSRAARALKRAIHAGLNAAGVNVDDVEMAPVAVTRFQVRSERAQGGVTVRLTPGDPESVTIRFFDADGTDVDEGGQRKIERSYHRQDFRRAIGADIGDLGFASRAFEYYTAALFRTVDGDAIRSAEYKLVVDVAYGSTAVVMPSVLAKLGAEVLSVNPYASTAGAAAFEPSDHCQRVSDLVRTASAHLGAVLDPDGERLWLIDERGTVLSHDQALLVFVKLVADAHPGATIALPVSVSRAAETLAVQAGAKVTWTKLAESNLMDVAATGGIDLAANQHGGYIFPEFLPAADATAALVSLLELVARSGRKLSSIVEDLPPVSIAHEQVVTPWEEKGMVMRTLVERTKDRDLVLVDGVKVLHDEGWALVVPDTEEAVTHVWAEAASEAEARGLAQEYARRIRQMLR